MAGDRVVIHSNQRASSDDINDLQAMQSQVLADFIAQLAAVRLIESTGALDTLPVTASLGLEARAAGGNLVAILPGVLAQFSLTHPAVPDQYESAQRIGMNRAPVNVAIPVAANTWMLIEARVVDVDAVTELRDQFNTTTEIFVPASLVTRRERRIEFQVVQGTTTSLPAFSGGTWFPLLAFTTDGAAAVPSLPVTDGQMFDMRPDLKDFLGDDQVRGVSSVQHPDGVLYQQAVSCAFHPATSPGTRAYSINGNCVGRINRHKMWIHALVDTAGPGTYFPVTADASAAASGNRLEHIYLAPLQANGVECAPIAILNVMGATAKGILVRSTVPPNVGSRTNSAVLDWPTGGFQNFDNVPIGRALHIASAYASVSGYFRWFSQDSGGRCDTQAHLGGPFDDLINETMVAFPDSVDLDLRTVIPPNARKAKIAVQFTGTDTTAWAGILTLKPLGGGADDLFPAVEFAAIGNDSGAAASYQIVDIPVQFGAVGTNEEGKRWVFDVNALGTPSLFLKVHVVGWSF